MIDTAQRRRLQSLADQDGDGGLDHGTRAALRQLLSAAGIDDLTGLSNRATLDAQLAAEIARAERTGDALGCLLLDLDGFKAVNDELGHLAGDAVLRAVAEALRAVVRPFDHVGRFGGDEFCLLLPGTNDIALREAADRVRAEVGRRASASAGRMVTTAIGAATLAPGQSPHELIDVADSAMLRAKRSTRGEVIVDTVRVLPGDPRPETEADADLVRALRGEGIRIEFQPIRDLRDDGIVGFEALARGPGVLERPDVLLAHAARSGQISSLDERLHREAFAQADAKGLTWPTALLVNVEPPTLVRMLEDDRFWHRPLHRFSSLSEVTERALMDRPGHLLRSVTRLRELGWGIALDDVGEDLRALSLLPLIAPDVVKLDLRLVQSQPDEALALVLLAISAQMEHDGTRVIAEGIETEEHRVKALGLGAQLGQGFLLGRPSTELTRPGPVSSSLPRVGDPRTAVGITPFELLSSSLPVQAADDDLLHHLQIGLEGRAVGIGQAALLLCAPGAGAPHEAISQRLARVAPTLGRVGLLGPPISDQSDLLQGALEPDDPLASEWVTVLSCPQYAVVLAARRHAPGVGGWRFALSHDRGLAVAIARQLLTRMP